MQYNRYLIIGLSGVGKTTLAKALGKKLNIVPYSMSYPLRLRYPNKTPTEYAELTKEILRENPNYFTNYALWGPMFDENLEDVITPRQIFEGIRNPYDFIQLVTDRTLVIDIYYPKGFDDNKISSWEFLGLQKIRDVLNTLNSYSTWADQPAPMQVHKIYQPEGYMNTEEEVEKILALGDS